MADVLLILDLLEDFRVTLEKFPIINNVKRLIDSARSRGWPVIFVGDAHLEVPDRLELDLFWGKHALRGTRGCKILTELTPVNEDYVLIKRKYSAFFETELDSILRALDARRILLAGILTDVCVRHTVADAFFRGYQTLIPRECVADLRQEINDQALKYMQRMYGTQVVAIETLLLHGDPP
jgi:nicotinamidase/pyrazinamidase